VHGDSSTKKAGQAERADAMAAGRRVQQKRGVAHGRACTGWDGKDMRRRMDGVSTKVNKAREVGSWRLPGVIHTINSHRHPRHQRAPPCTPEPIAVNIHARRAQHYRGPPTSKRMLTLSRADASEGRLPLKSTGHCARRAPSARDGRSERWHLQGRIRRDQRAARSGDYNGGMPSI